MSLARETTLINLFLCQSIAAQMHNHSTAFLYIAHMILSVLLLLKLGQHTDMFSCLTVKSAIEGLLVY